MKITAVVVTKGDRDISPVTESLKHFDELIVWDNSKDRDLKVFGRYAGAFIARNNTIYIQDDDCLIESEKLVEEYGNYSDIYADPVLCNFPKNRRIEYAGSGISLLGWGTIFTKTSLVNFTQYLNYFPFDELFLRECDRVFSYLVTLNLTDLGVQHLPYAHGDDRMGREQRHHQDLIEIKRRLKSLPL